MERAGKTIFAKWSFLRGKLSWEAQEFGMLSSFGRNAIIALLFGKIFILANICIYASLFRYFRTSYRMFMQTVLPINFACFFCIFFTF